MALTLDGYFKGNAYKLTGEIEDYYGGKFYLAVLLEGHEKGKTVAIAARHVEN